MTNTLLHNNKLHVTRCKCFKTYRLRFKDKLNGIQLPGLSLTTAVLSSMESSTVTRHPHGHLAEVDTVNEIMLLPKKKDRRYFRYSERFFQFISSHHLGSPPVTASLTTDVIQTNPPPTIPRRRQLMWLAGAVVISTVCLMGIYCHALLHNVISVKVCFTKVHKAFCCFSGVSGFSLFTNTSTLLSKQMKRRVSTPWR